MPPDSAPTDRAAVRLQVHPRDEVLVPAGTALGELRAGLARVLLRPELEDADLLADGAPVGDAHLVGVRPLLPGTTLSTRSDVRATRPGQGIGRRSARSTGRGARAGAGDAPDMVLQAAWHVAVVAGPGAGTLHPIAAGARAREVRVRDVRVRERSRRVRVRAPRTARWADRPGHALWTGRGRRWRPGRTLVVDGAYLVLRPSPAGATGLRREGDRALAAPAPDPELAHDAQAATAPRSVPERRRALAVALAPAVVALALAAVLHQPMLAAFAVLGPVGLVAGQLGSGHRTPGRPRPEAGSWDPRPADARATVTLRRYAAAGLGPGPAPDGTLASGTSRAGADGAAQLTVPTPPTPAVLPAPPRLPDGCLALTGPDDLVAALARSIAVDHAVAGRTVLVTAGPVVRDDWAWTRWLPNPRARGEPLVVVDARDGAAPTGSPPSGQVLVLATTPDAVPAWCRATAQVRRSRATGEVSVRWDVPGRPRGTSPFAGTSRAWAELIARDLAGADALGHGPATGALTTVALAELLGLRAEPADARTIAEHWARSRTSGLVATVGTAASGPFLVDLVQDGPHALVAGTTGSGKSELLQALLLALATRYPPDELGLALVDFKGGASFGDCVRLPHVVGSVTDLDATLAGRALAGLRAELARRERLLAAAGRTRLDEPLDTPDGRLGRLVVVVDEFRALADDLPEFVPGLLRVAAQGRSLGMHLVLATQRPAGAVTGDLRANLALRVALRVTDPADSIDVIGVPDAARLGPAPGFAVVKRGSGETEHVRVAHAAAFPGRAAVRLAPPWGSVPAGPNVGSRPGARGDAGTGTRDAAAALVDATIQAAHDRGVRRQRAPWAPPLPPLVAARDLSATADLGDAVRPDARADESPERVPFALLDAPDEQRHRPAAWDPVSGTLVVVGRPRSGRTTTLRTVADAWLHTGRVVHVLAEHPRAWAATTEHPLAGTLVGTDDPVRAARLLRLLADPARAADLLVVDGAEALRDALAGLARGAGADLLDDVLARRPHCATSMTGMPRGALASGPRVILATGDRHDDALLGIPTALAGWAAAPGRGVLLADAAAHACQVAVGPPAAAPPYAAQPGGIGGAIASAPPGRCGPRTSPLRLAPLPTRVALHDLTISAAAGPSADADGRFGTGRAPEARLALGRGGDDGGLVTVDPSAGLLVAGPAGSGRSTALLALATDAARTGRLRCVTAAHDALLETARRAGCEALDPRRLDPTAVAERIGAALDHPGLVLVDGLDDVAAADPRTCEAWGTPTRLSGLPGRLVGSASTPAVLGTTRGPVAALRRSRRGVLLAAHEPGASEVFGVDVSWLATPRAHTQGRAVVVDGVSAVLCRIAS